MTSPMRHFGITNAFVMKNWILKGNQVIFGKKNNSNFLKGLQKSKKGNKIIWKEGFGDKRDKLLDVLIILEGK